MVESRPKMQKALLYNEDQTLTVGEVPIPVPQSGQVLVKLEFAPLNPSDVYLLKGYYARSDNANFGYPFTPGWEGSGTVIQSGGGFMGWKLMGKRVAVTKTSEPEGRLSIGGCYQQYMVTSVFQCIELPQNVSFEQGSMFCVNPLTAISFLEIAQEKKAQALVQTAACSQLGKMVIALCQERRLPLINIVRKETQVQELKALNCEYVLNSSDSDFLEQLGTLAKKLRATVCFEAIAGPITGQIMSKLPYGATCYLYGLLSEEPVSEIEPLLVIGRKQQLKTFFLGTYFETKSIFALMGIVKRASQMLERQVFHPTVAKYISIDEIKDSVDEYMSNMGAGKYLVQHSKHETS